MASQKKLVVIGAGPGGYTAAFMAADAGIPVTLIDERAKLGGVCLNEGCIPVKTLLNAAHTIPICKEAIKFGITYENPRIDFKKLCDWKNSVTTRLTSGLAALAKQRNVEFIQGKASFINSKTIRIQKCSGEESKIDYTHAIIACGSVPVKLPLGDSPGIIDSSAALELNDIPGSMLIIGGGYIGVEMGSIFSYLGTKVSIVEMLPQLLTGTDPDLLRVLLQKLQKNFQSIMLNSKVIRADEKAGKIEVEIIDQKGQTKTCDFDKILVAVGRKPETSALALKSTQIETDEKGFILVNEYRQTAEPNIYAIGDVIGQPMLAHKAAHEARAAVQNIVGNKKIFKPKCIPAVIFTDPEIAYCGLTEQQAKEKGLAVKITKFPWAASGRAMTLNGTEGFTKLITDPATNKILGGAIAGVNAGEMISEIALAIESDLDASAIKNTIHPHPTLSETIMETADYIFGECTHLYKPNK